MKDKTWIMEIDASDPWIGQKKSAVDSFQGVVDEIRRNREMIYSKIYFSISIISAVLIAIFSEYFSGVIIIALIDILMIVLIFPAKDYYYRRKELSRCKDDVEKKFKELGMKMER